MVKVPIQKTQHNQSFASFCLLNARSAYKKVELIKDYILVNDIDICAKTESSLSENDKPVVGDFKADGYKLSHVGRSDKKGGGVLVLCKTSLNPELSSVASFTSFECMNVKLKSLDTVINLAVIYRPPCNHNVPVSMYLEIITPSDGKLLVVGDFNFHLDDAKNDHSESFIELLNIFSLRQHVSFSTHSKGHILELIITAESDDTVSSVRKGIQFSDHFSIICNLLGSKPPILKKEVEY